MSEIKSIHQIQLSAKPWGQAYDNVHDLLAIACFSEEQNTLEVVCLNVKDYSIEYSLEFDFSEVQVLQEFYDGILVLASFDEENAQVEKVSGFDIKENTWVWSLEGCSFEGRIKEGLLFKDVQKSSLRLVNKNYDVIPFESSLNFIPSAILKPKLYTEGSSYFNTVAEYINTKYSIQVCEHIEYLEAKQVIVISYYLREGSSLSNFLLILNADGTELHREKLADNLPGVGLESFYSLNDFLVTIDQNKNLTLINL